MVGAESPPRLILNDHCQVCEFRQRCHDQAVQEDNISLLRGMGEKEVKSYARKGIFTVTQLAHTFRPRRRGKRSPPKKNHRYHALQALALSRADELGDVRARGPPDQPPHAGGDAEELLRFIGVRAGNRQIQAHDGTVLPAVLQDAASTRSSPAKSFMWTRRR